MKRRLFNLATILSLVIGAGVVLCWLVGHYRGDTVVHARAEPSGAVTFYGISNSSGGAFLYVLHTQGPPSGKYSSGWQHTSNVNPIRWSNVRNEFHVLPASQATRASDGKPGHFSSLYIPDYIFLVAFLILPAIWLIIHGRRKRRKRLLEEGFCIHCGYDMRATPNQCPECGREPDHVFAGVIPINRLSK